MPESPTEATLRVSVVIPTRDRGAEVLHSVASVLANDSPPFELIVVDQSTDDKTETTLRPLLHDPRLQFLKTRTTGISAARNLGIERARGEIIGLTDDDCVVPSTWVRVMRESLEADPGTGLVFGVVIPGEHDEAAGFIPGFRRQRPALARTAGQSHKIGGMGACMATRKSVWRQLGGFDERFGVGSPIGAGEETDFSIRTLLAGHSVRVNPDLRVVHHGFRTWESGKSLIHRYWSGTGTAFALNVKVAPWPITRSLFGLSSDWLSSSSAIAQTLGDGSHRWSRLSSFTQGFLAGLTLPSRQDPAGREL